MRNIYNVNKKKWKKWSEVGKQVFNDVHHAMIDNPELYWHPKQGKITKQYWSTTAWNAAWIAADYATEAAKS